MECYWCLACRCLVSAAVTSGSRTPLLHRQASESSSNCCEVGHSKHVELHGLQTAHMLENWESAFGVAFDLHRMAILRGHLDRQCCVPPAPCLCLDTKIRKHVCIPRPCVPNNPCQNCLLCPCTIALHTCSPQCVQCMVATMKIVYMGACVMCADLRILRVTMVFSVITANSCPTNTVCTTRHWCHVVQEEQHSRPGTSIQHFPPEKIIQCAS